MTRQYIIGRLRRTGTGPRPSPCGPGMWEEAVTRKRGSGGSGPGPISGVRPLAHGCAVTGPAAGSRSLTGRAGGRSGTIIQSTSKIGLSPCPAHGRHESHGLSSQIHSGPGAAPASRRAAPRTWSVSSRSTNCINSSGLAWISPRSRFSIMFASAPT